MVSDDLDSMEVYLDQCQAKLNVTKTKQERYSTLASDLKPNLPPSLQLAVSLAQEKGASSWLSAILLSQHGLSLHKGGFRDALCLRYGWQPLNVPAACACGTRDGTPFTLDHSLSCPKGGLPTIRHNEIRDIFASWMSEVCTNVQTEPILQPLSNEILHGRTANREEEARLDIAADGLWGGHFERFYFDIRIFNPFARSNRLQNQKAVFRKHENEKKRAYEQRVREIEQSSFIPVVLSLTGSLGNGASSCLKRLASLLSIKWDFPYNRTISWLRVRLSYALLRSSIRCIRGARTTNKSFVNQNHLPLDLILKESNIHF
jgi:hypothetical protein